MKAATHQLRCTECGARIAGNAVNSIFRCPTCNGLYDVIYPWSATPEGESTAAKLPNASALRWLWQERRTSTLGVDQSAPVTAIREAWEIVRRLLAGDASGFAGRRFSLASPRAARTASAASRPERSTPFSEGLSRASWPKDST